MANPALNEQTFKKARQEDQAGWAAVTATGAGRGADGTVWNPPVDDGPISPYRTSVMTMSGTVTATAVMFVVLLTTAAFGWNAVARPVEGEIRLPGWVLPVLLGALGVAILTVFKPKLARFTGILYAALEGLVVGAISRMYELQWNGIVVQAAGATVAVFASMLFLYATRVIKVTDRFRRIVIGATVGVMIFYGISLLLSLFGATPPFINSPSAFGIGFSLIVVGIAAMNLALDFDLIERGVQAGAPRYMEWYSGFGLMVTVVWLYLEILRLLSKLRER